MIKKLASHLGEYRRAAILTPMFSALEAVMDILLPTIMAFIIDLGIEKGDMNAIVKYGLLTFAVAAIALLLGVLAGRYAAEASTGFAGNLRDAMYENIQHYSFSNIDKFSTAGLVTRMTTDVTNLQNAFQMMERMCVRAPVHLVFALIMAFGIGGPLALIFVAAVAFLLAVLASIMVPTFKIFDRVFKNYDNLNSSVQENVSAIRVVKSFVREGFENEKYTKACEGLYQQFVNAESRLSFNGPAMLTAIYGCNIALSWFGAKYILHGALTTGQLNALFGYIMNILMALMMLSMAFVMISMSAASVKRIVEVLDEKTDLPPAKAPVQEVKDGSIRFDHVTFKYKHGSGQPVLNDITFDIKPGETLGIIGGTGSAKSSLVQLIPRLYDAETGTVSVGGVDVRDYNLDVLRHEVSMVLQKNVLFSGTILDNLRWGNENASEEECIRVAKLACADEFIERFPDKYNTWIEQGGSNVSGGQKQRLTIARALLRKPKVLILDDSTSAVDTATDAKIRKAFREEIPGTTKIIIAQRISSVQDADRILVLDNGQINGLGTHEELLKNNAIYQEVYNSQTQGGGDFDKQGGEQ
ncbi:MAG: ABC transporter ATP-binding protein [Faecalibacterium prausnitzii]